MHTHMHSPILNCLPFSHENQSHWQSIYGFVSDHYSVLADQEPLYQFYAAAVARVAFESDSEGYEEVIFFSHLQI